MRVLVAGYRNNIIMKVFRLPKDVPAPVVDYSFYNREKEASAEKEHCEKLKAFLIRNGYTGKHTGELVTFPVADGYAVYMMAEGSRSCLIHLPYGDGYHYRDVSFLPKAEIIRRIAAAVQDAA